MELCEGERENGMRHTNITCERKERLLRQKEVEVLRKCERVLLVEREHSSRCTDIYIEWFKLSLLKIERGREHQERG